MTERLDYRSGIEGWNGAPLRLASLPHPHSHYCELHDHRWTCDRSPCTQHEAVPCPA